MWRYVFRTVLALVHCIPNVHLAPISQVTVVGSFALSFFFPSPHEKVRANGLVVIQLHINQSLLQLQIVVQISAVQSLAMTLVVFSSSCVRKPTLYAVAWVFSMWSTVTLVSSAMLVSGCCDI